MVPVVGAWIKRPGTTETETRVKGAEDALLGLWSRFKPEKDGDPQRFYYFHRGGIGLYRYGRMGLTYTQTFRYDVTRSAIKLTFNKGRDRYSASYRIDGDQLVLHDDPRMGGKQTYTKRPPPAAGGDFESFDHPMARLWTESVEGGKGFRMYQLQAPTIDGRGVGWYHEGDFHEWSTETLEYRRTGDRLSLFFPVRNERHVTRLTEGKASGVRTLQLDEDPRNFWHPRTYRDGGPGFTMLVAGGPLPYHVPGHGVTRNARSCPHR